MDAEAQPNSDVIGVPAVYPWGRYWATFIDANLWVVVLAVAVALTLPALLANTLVLFLLFAVTYPAAHGFSIALTGTTPGKAAFRSSVVRWDGGRLSLKVAIRRSYAAWARGAFAGVPIIGLFAMINAYNELKEKRTTSWDRDVGAQYVAHRPAWWSWLLLVATLVLYVWVFSQAE